MHVNDRLNKSSTFAALRNPLYRKLWFAVLLSGTCVAAHDTAATWTMNKLGSSTFLLSLMSTVASLPFFLFTPPAGALADLVNRRKLLCFINLWLAAAAGLLSILGSLHLVNPYVLLFCVFLIGAGFAFHSPAWSAIVPDVVTNEELPSAATLGGLQLNVSGIIGPALGGILLYFFGANWVFALNALCFAVVIFALLQWKGARAESEFPLENFVESFATAIRYVRYTPAIHVVLARNVLFAFFISVIPALMPVLGLKELHLQPCSLGLLFTSMGAGSIFGAVFVLPVVRKRLSSNASTTLANLLVAMAYLLMAFVRQPLIFMIIAALAGLGWTLGASELWVAGQRAIPGWARGRMSAIVIMVSQGAISLGGVVWGFSSQAAGVNIMLIVAGVTLVLSLPLAARLSINFTTSLSFDPPPISCVMSPLVYNPQPRDGPVAITFEFEVDQLRGREFLQLMRELRLIHLRNGAFDWRLDEDLTRSTTYRIEMMVPSWTGYLLQRQRLTKAEQEIIKKVWRLHVGEQIPLERYYLCVNRELEAQHVAQENASSTPTIPLDLDAQHLPGTS
ncbi:MAG TPA: MFS transporter [Chthoniobacterales bacterium]|nr:MFS transporter [Chthoniobacterales bacterium]